MRLSPAPFTTHVYKNYAILFILAYVRINCRDKESTEWVTFSQEGSFVYSGNLTEGLHNRFRCLMGRSNHTIWRFIDVLKKEQDLTNWKINQKMMRQPPHHPFCLKNISHNVGETVIVKYVVCINVVCLEVKWS